MAKPRTACPSEAQKSEAHMSLIKTPKSLGSCMYINTRSTAHSKQILHYPNPLKSQDLKKGRLEPARNPKTWGSHITIAFVAWVGLLLNSARLKIYSSTQCIWRAMEGSTRWLWTSPTLTRYGLKLELGHFIISGREFAFSNLTIIWGILGPSPILMHIWHFSYHHHQYEFYRIPILGHYFWNILCKLSKCNLHASATPESDNK